MEILYNTLQLYKYCTILFSCINIVQCSSAVEILYNTLQLPYLLFLLFLCLSTNWRWKNSLCVENKTSCYIDKLFGYMWWCGRSRICAITCSPNCADFLSALHFCPTCPKTIHQHTTNKQPTYSRHTTIIISQLLVEQITVRHLTQGTQSSITLAQL